jgi:hypothetical protein
MLTPVGLGQTRLVLPGLTADGRGVVAGRELGARFGTMDRVVWFFRLLSGERPPDEIWLGLRIMHMRSSLGLRELLVIMPNPGQAADVVARAARGAGGQCFTGSGRHYVQYRDTRAPFGYDVTVPSDQPADVTLYASDGDVGYRLEGEWAFDRLLFGLSLRRRPGSVESLAPSGPGSILYVTARRGLGARLAEHLNRAGVNVQAALCESPRPTVFSAGEAFWLLRIEDLPPRLLTLVCGTPGLQPFAPVLENVLVALGWSHPFHLEALRPLFGSERCVLFSPPPAPATVLPRVPPWVAAADLAPLRPLALGDAAPATAAPSVPPLFEVSLRLESDPSRPARAVAAWIPWNQAAWLRRLCYAMPPAMLRGHRAALLEPAVLVLGGGDLAGLPFGQLLDELAPGVLVPVGMRLAPAIAPERLIQRLALPEGSYLVFPGPTAPPVRIAPNQLETLERRILAHARLEPERPPSARRAFVPPDDAAPPEVIHEALGPWPLWGLRR